jgi:hypothetical protein
MRRLRFVTSASAGAGGGDPDSLPGTTSPPGKGDPRAVSFRSGKAPWWFYEICAVPSRQVCRVKAVPQTGHGIWRHGASRWCGAVFPHLGHTQLSPGPAANSPPRPWPPGPMPRPIPRPPPDEPPPPPRGIVHSFSGPAVDRDPHVSIREKVAFPGWRITIPSWRRFRVVVCAVAGSAVSVPDARRGPSRTRCQPPKPSPPRSAPVERVGLPMREGPIRLSPSPASPWHGTSAATLGRRPAPWPC